MKANELRIGNLIETGNVSCYATISTIYHAEDFNPIQLTEEWLLKFGFTHKYLENKDGEVLTDDYIISLGSWSDLSIETDFSFGIQSKNSDDLNCFENDTISSVHQLQNLFFALCGKELIIDLRDE